MTTTMKMMAMMTRVVLTIFSRRSQVHIETARELLGTELSALVGESYERAYADMVS
jgi:hypothetical protein